MIRWCEVPLPARKMKPVLAGLGLALGLGLVTALVPAQAAGQGPNSVLLEQLTSTELRSRIEHGATTVLIPIGGVEQSGPYIALGKHNARAAIIAKMIAEKLGNTIVAPLVSYVPEGAINPPQGHMKHTGTLSIPVPAFEALLEGAAASLRQHGFRDIIFIGDHGGYQKSEAHVADKLNHAWAKDPSARAYALLNYYTVTETAYVADLKQRGFSTAEIGLHAGLADAALMLATDPSMVRSDAMARGPKPGVADGVRGDATRATAELGRLGVARQVDTSVTEITALLRAHRQ